MGRAVRLIGGLRDVLYKQSDTRLELLTMARRCFGLDCRAHLSHPWGCSPVKGMAVRI